MSYEARGLSVAGVARAWVRFFLPYSCLSCGDEVLGVLEEEQLGLCGRCQARLVSAGPGLCGGCGQKMDEADSETQIGRRCARCSNQPPAWDQLLWAFAYKPPLDSVIMGLKFRRLDYLGVRLGERLAVAIGEDLPPVDAVVPVPLHWSRRLRRGYDQAGLIASGVGEALRQPVLDALRRQRRTAAQSHRDRAHRRTNLQGAFKTRRQVVGLRLLLVDDVVTTGATLEMAARVLRHAGAASVVAAVVARTPRPGEDTDGGLGV